MQGLHVSKNGVQTHNVQEMHKSHEGVNTNVTMKVKSIKELIKQVKLHFATTITKMKYKDDYDIFVKMNSEKKFFIELKKNYINNLLSDIAKIFFDNNYNFHYSIKEINVKSFEDSNKKTNYIVYVITQISISRDDINLVFEDVAESIVRVQEAAEYKDTVSIRVAETRSMSRVLNKFLDNLLFSVLEEMSQSFEDYYNNNLSNIEKDYFYNIFYVKNTKKIEEFIDDIYKNCDIDIKKICIAYNVINKIKNELS